MRFQRDWLRRVLTVPYVPTLGPVHPDTLTPDLFDEVIAASRAGRVLPFDKNRRWSHHKPDAVLAEEIVHRPEHTIIPVLSRRGAGTVKTYYYATQPPEQAALRAATRRWCAAHSAAAGRVIWFDPATPRPPRPAPACCSKSSATTHPRRRPRPGGSSRSRTARPRCA